MKTMPHVVRYQRSTEDPKQHPTPGSIERYLVGLAVQRGCIKAQVRESRRGEFMAYNDDGTADVLECLDLKRAVQAQS